MGNKAVEAFKDEEIISSPCERKYCLVEGDEFIAKKNVKIIGKSGKEWGSTEYFDSETDELIFKTNYKTTGLGKRDVFIFDKSLKCVVTLKCEQNILKKNMLFVYRSKPMFDGQTAEKDGFYQCAEVEITTGMTEQSSVCSFLESADGAKTSIYAAKKISAMKFFALVRNSATETTIAKAYEGPFSVSNPTQILEVSSGSDILVAWLLATSVVSGGGSSAGALAGAGVT